MRWDSELVRRAYIALEGLAFEIVDSEEFGMPLVIVTDCLDETQKALYVPEKDGKPFEKSSTFRTDERQYLVDELIRDNWPMLLERLNG